jgi:phenylpyruvate tautomerase PptA (4-oxalocrotonate tautomerase family)
MPMIDVYARRGMFEDLHGLALSLATAVMEVEKVPNIAMFRQNTAAFVHEMAPEAISNVDGDGDYVRVQVITNSGALDRDKQIELVVRLTETIATAPGNPPAPERVWVLLTEATPGGWGLWGHAQTNDELIAAARRALAADSDVAP